tara:strand:+ start:2904 stop:6644 length:3741 start_codon:yes stop_codon:yes gene_type:complete
MVRLVDDQLFGDSGKIQDENLIEGALRSKTFATVVDLLGYGEIEGILDEGGDGTDTFRKNVFLDKTPLLNAVGTENFQDVTVEQRTGLSNQPKVQMVNATEINLGGQFPKEITKSASVTETITNTSIDKIRVTIQIPQLQEFTDNGGISKQQVQITIKITESNGNVRTPVTEDDPESIIEGKVSNNFLKDYEIKFDPDINLNFPLSVTVTRVTADSSDQNKIRNKTFLAGITQIITETNQYNNFAYVATRFNAETFRSYPRRMFRVKGTKIRIPAPYTADGVTLTPQADTNNGRIIYPDGYIFQGVLTTTKVWSSDPAFVLFDLLTTDKGFGGPDGIIKEENLDLFSFFEASKYSSALITDPITKTTEPRFSTNIILNQRRDAYSLISDLCSVMRAEAFYSNGSLSIVQDRPTNTATNTSDPQYIFNNSNISEQGFSYSTVGQKTKFTEVEVSYFNNDTQDLDFEYVSANQIKSLFGYTTRFGNIRKTLKTFACTSRGQANRFGRWFLYTNLKETQICSFTATLEAGVYIRPSTIIGIADSLKAGIRRGGRINSVNDSQGDGNIDQIIVDDANNTDLADSNNAKLSVVLSNIKEIDANTKQNTMIETRDISSISGRTITVTSPFTSTAELKPQANSVWAIENTDVEFQTYRVISVEEENHCEYKITAIIHDTNKYAQVEDPEIAANPRNIRTLIDEKPSPSLLEAEERIIVLNDRAVSAIFVTWQPVQGVKEYYLEFVGPNDNPQTLRVTRPDFTLKESELGQYTFKVKSINALGVMSSTTSSVSLKTFGKTALPNNIQNLGIETISDKLVRLRFDQSTDVDVLHGGTVVIRASNITDGTGSFSNSTTIKEVSGNSTEAEVPNIISGEYVLKFKDDGNRLSAGETSVIYNSPDVFPKLVVFNNREDTQSTPFSGTKTNCSFNSTKNGLVLNGSTGEYFFNTPLDLGSVNSVNLKRHLITEGFYSSTNFDSRTALIDTWTSFDQITAVDVDATLLVATSDGDPTQTDNATYSHGASGDQPSKVLTIRRNNHGLKQGDMIYINFTSGLFQNNTTLGGSDRQYQVVAMDDDNKFYVSATAIIVAISNAINNQLNVNGNCTISKAFTRFNTFVNGSFVARAFKFKIKMESKDPAQSIVIKQLGYLADMESRTETSLGNAGAVNGESFIVSGNTTKSVLFTNSFFTGQANTNVAAFSVLPSIGITIENAQSGDYFSLSSITGSGFSIDIKNGTNNVSRNFKYTATGFGRVS